ncbi:LLM class flavin-dependent oxidoreductase [Orrella daihaiensis]|uniref:LLM class flavin-dependent oxidoreductase n=1 Tax=Orrella daihaiensis TaxID=2782176 RepID=A0ABY4AH77_9BURK|nr:LLM class flavin-dependent oxidoreductase [Orrella daihaiensis]UOD49539.1 LLM class flavin-dependent oxidoreductase [Orrella daihaiensis]
MTPYSILDLSPIPQGSTARHALNNSLGLAQHAERLGYRRYWLAEHHNMIGNASSATAVVISHVASGTSHIRLGSGGVMLPNHSPLVIAEQFGTLACLYPDRIDLGLGRAPGTDPMTARALRRDLQESNEGFPQDVLELQAYLSREGDQLPVKAVPGTGTEVPIWILGSSLYGAQLAAHFGLPYAFASHFAPADLFDALAVYRQTFKPSKQLAKPYAMVLVNVVAAATDHEARYLFTSVQQHFVRMRRNTRGQLPPPIDKIDEFWSEAERQFASQMLACSVVGGPDTVRAGLAQILGQTHADELMFAGQIFDHQARLDSFAIAANAMNQIDHLSPVVSEPI